MSSALERRLSRRRFLGATAAGGAALLMGGGASSALAYDPPTDAGIRRARRRDEDEDWFEASFRDLQRLMRRGEISSVGLTKAYLRRIRDLNPVLGAVIETNPQVLKIAAQRDKERRRHRVRGPLHGIPILLKDNIATNDRMETTAGSLALEGSQVRRDAEIVTRLRRAGAVVLGQGQPVGMGQLPRLHPAGLPERLECARRLHAQPVRAGLGSVRLELRLGGRCGGQPVRWCRRHRDRRVDPVPGRQQRRGRDQAHARAGVAARDHPDRPLAGHGRSDDPDRHRCGADAQRDEVAIRAGEGSPAAAGLHEVPQARVAEGRPHRRRPAELPGGLLRRPGAQPRDRGGARRHGRCRGHDHRHRPGGVPRPEHLVRPGVHGPAERVQARPRGLPEAARATRRCGRWPT